MLDSLTDWREEPLWNEFVRIAVGVLANLSGRTLAVLYHADHDGTAAAAILSVLCRERSGTHPQTVIPMIESPYEITDSHVKLLSSTLPSLVIILDLPVDRDPDVLRAIADGVRSRILIYDHHVPQRSVEVSNCTYLNPRLSFPSTADSPPSCYFMHYVYRAMGGRKDVCWLSAAGVVGDMAADVCEDVIEEARDHYPSLWLPRDTQLSEYRGLTELARALNVGRFFGKDGPKLTLRAAIRAAEYEDPSILLSTGTYAARLRKMRAIVDREVDRQVKLFGDRACIIPDLRLAIFQTQLKMPIENAVVSSMRALYPNYLTVLVSNRSGRAIIELRSGTSGIDVTELIQQCTIGMENALGGGHHAAGGVEIPLADVATFVERMKTFVGERIERNQTIRGSSG